MDQKNAEKWNVAEAYASELGDFTILDLYLANDHASDLRLLSVFNVDIALDAGAFVHHDADAEGHWSAAYNLMGANTAIDSFATFGAMSGDDPFLAALDPNFSGAVAGSVSADAGWYNDDPTNGQGNVAVGSRVFVGRFVVANTLPSGTTFTVSSTISYNFQSPGVHFDNDSQVFTLPSVVPGPLAFVAVAGIGLAGRGRRR